MQKPFRIFSIVTLIFVFFSCEQHFFYLKKVKANNETSKIENQSKRNQPSETIEFSSTFKPQDSNEVLIAKTHSEFLEASIDTPKPYIIKKLPEVEEENLNIKKPETQSQDFNKPQEKKFPVKVFIGLLMLVVGIFLSIIAYVTLQNEKANPTEGGCAVIFFGLVFGILGISLSIPGLVLIITGIFQS